MSTTTPSRAAFVDRLAAHEVRVGDARPGRGDRRLLVDLLVGVEQGVHGAVADAVGRELQARLDGRPDHRHQPLPGDEQHAAIVRVVDRVDLAHAPGLAHVGAAGEHAAVEEGLDPDDPEPRPALAERVLGHLADLREDLVERARGCRRAARCRGGPSGRRPRAAAGSGRRAEALGVAVDHGGDPDRVVVLEQLEQAPVLVLLGGLALRRRRPSRTA